MKVSFPASDIPQCQLQCVHVKSAVERYLPISLRNCCCGHAAKCQQFEFVFFGSNAKSASEHGEM